MQNIRLAVHLPSLRLPFKQALHTAARLGAAGVEIDARTTLRPEELTQTGTRHVRKLLEDQNLRVAAMSFPTRHGFHVPEQLERRIEATRRVLQMAQRLGTPWVVVSLGAIPSPDEQASWNLLVEVLGDLARYGDHVGAMLAAETGLDDGSLLAKLVQSLPEGALWVAFNPGALLVHGHDPKKALETLARWVVYLYATDGVRDPNRGRGMAVPLGRGAADFLTLLGILEEHHYKGYATVAREHSDDPESEIAAALQYLKNLTS